MRSSVLVLVALLSLSPGISRAECAAGAVPSALAARIDRNGLEVLRPPLVEMIPRTYDLPDKTAELFSCTGFFDPTVVHTSQGKVALDIHDTAILLGDGFIDISVSGDVVADAALALEICGYEDSACPGTVTANRVTLRARLRPTVTSCAADFTFDSFEMLVAEEDVTATLGDCGLYGDILDLVHDSVRALLLDYAVTALEDFLRDLLVDYVESFTTELFARRLEGGRLVISAEPERVTVTPTALSVSFRANASPARQDACVANANALAALETPVSAEGFSLPNSMVGVGASAAFAQRVVRAAWLAGWMCFDTRVVDVDLEKWITPLLPGATVMATLRATTEPLLSLAPLPSIDAHLSVAGVEGHIEIALPNGERYPATATAQLGVQASIGIDEATRSVALSAEDLALQQLQVRLGASTLGFSEESVSAFITNAVLPAFAGEMEDIPLITGVLAGAPVAATLDAVGVREEAVTAALTLLPVDTGDQVPPSTAVGSSPRCPCGPTVVLQTSSTDNATPDGLVRHRVTIDGRTESGLRAGTELRLGALLAGRHTIEIRAVDLAGNVDPTPVQVSVDVDDEAPIVRFTSFPVGMIPVDGTELAVEATDDVSPSGKLQMRYVVGVVSRANEPDDRFTGQTFAPGERIRLNGMPDLSTIRVIAYARDEAGNEGEAELTFAVVDQPSMGCHATGPATSWLWLAVAGVSLRLRRRARRPDR